MKKYDFVLFESSESINHLKDIELIADLLESSGYSVAIADVLNEKTYCTNSRFDHIGFTKKNPAKFYTKKDIPNKIKRGLLNRLAVVRHERFLKYVAKELNNISNNIYAGSCENGRSFSWIKQVNSNINIFLWGLRSYRIYEYRLKPLSIVGFNSYFNKKYYFEYPNLMFFVSDEMIKAEFENLGISSNRLVIRPERYTEIVSQMPVRHQQGKISLLSIGTIRREKRVEKCIDAVSSIDNNNISYTIAGSSGANFDYESLINDLIKDRQYVRRINTRLSEEEYEDIFNSADFLLLADKKQESNVTNGTMNEALLKGIPIIAPNYNPYKYIVNEYKVGILYDPNDIETLKSSILHALEIGPDFYAEGLITYQKTLLKETIAKKLFMDLQKSTK